MHSVRTLPGVLASIQPGPHPEFVNLGVWQILHISKSPFRSMFACQQEQCSAMWKENEAILKVILSIEKFKGDYSLFCNAVLQNGYSPDYKNFSRLLLWKTCLITESLNIKIWKERLQSSRAVYHELSRAPSMTIPWWLLKADSEYFTALPVPEKDHVPRTLRRPTRIQNPTSDPLINEPAEQMASNKYFDVELDAELLRVIILDVQRLFPGDSQFHGADKDCLAHRRRIISILFVWSKCNVDVGYKQGIHEILGLIYKNLWSESVNISNTNTLSFEDLEILSLYDVKYLEHDLFCILNKFVANSGVMGQFYQSETALRGAIKKFNGYLMKVDQLLHYNLITKLRLDTELWSIRFFRLLLLRELGNDLAIQSSFWDKLVAAEAFSSPSHQAIPELLYFSIIILLINVKADLALCDFAEAMLLLLHYPISSRLHLHPNFVDLLFQDAYRLWTYRHTDLKLYEYGIKLNERYASVIRVSFGVESQSIAKGIRLNTVPSTCEIKRENSAFEKSRMENRLKKRVQLFLKN